MPYSAALENVENINNHIVSLLLFGYLIQREKIENFYVFVDCD